jgi:3-methyladenine DNA glycosylase AlkD
VKQHPEKEQMRLKWMKDKHPSVARAGWSLTTERVSKQPDGIDLEGLLDRIEKEMGKAPELAKWNMNFCLIEIGIKNPKLRKRAMAIGEKVGAYRDYPVSKGCTSPFAPIAIEALSKRN